MACPVPPAKGAQRAWPAPGSLTPGGSGVRATSQGLWSPLPASPEAVLLPHAPGGTRLPKRWSLQHHGSRGRTEETGQRWSVAAKGTQTWGNGEGLGLHPDLGVFTQPLDTTKGTPNVDCRPVASELAQWRQLGGPCVPRTGGRLYPQPGPQPRGAVSSVCRLWGPPRGQGQDSRGRCGHSRPGPAGTGVPAVNSASCHLPKRSTCPGGR